MNLRCTEAHNTQANLLNRLVSIKYCVYISIFCIVFLQGSKGTPTLMECNKNGTITTEINATITDISDDPIPPPRGSAIFFIDTSCSPPTDSWISLNPRQACAVESAAKMHRDTIVYLLYIYPMEIPVNVATGQYNTRIVEALLLYSNIKIRTVNIRKYAKGTPMEKWTGLDELLVEHSRDVLKYLTLWKYGGTYMDLNVVVMKNLNVLGKNFVGMKNDANVGSGIVNLDSEKLGRRVAADSLSYIKIHYRPNKWSSQGLNILGKILERYCDTTVSRWSKNTCKGFNVLDTRAFYPIPQDEWSSYYDPRKLPSVLDNVNNTYIVYIWNKKSELNVKLDNKQHLMAYGFIAKQRCPLVFAQTFSYF